MLKFLNRFRRRLAGSIAPPLKPWSNVTHTAYPESYTQPDGFWRVRFYAYEPFAWRFQGEQHEQRPAFPEPNMAHPTSYEEGRAPAHVREAWAQYYRERPEPVTLLEEFTGQARNQAVAKRIALGVVSRGLDRHRRVNA